MSCKLILKQYWTADNNHPSSGAFVGLLGGIPCIIIHKCFCQSPAGLAFFQAVGKERAEGRLQHWGAIDSSKLVLDSQRASCPLSSVVMRTRPKDQAAAPSSLRARFYGELFCTRLQTSHASTARLRVAVASRTRVYVYDPSLKKGTARAAAGYRGPRPPHAPPRARLGGRRRPLPLNRRDSDKGA